MTGIAAAPVNASRGELSRGKVRVAAAGLFLAFLAFHLPFLPASLEDLDSINFALGVRRFDVARHQPHPPGYPVFIAAAKIAHRIAASEAMAISLVGVVAGGLAVFALIAFFRRVDPGPRAREWSVVATLLAVTSPMYWFTAVRPLSDTAGLAAALAVQAMTIASTSRRGLVAASFLAAFAMGLRSQVFWLTVPLLILTIARLPADQRGRAAVTAIGAFVAGALVWALPLVVLTGGPRAYWHAVFYQGSQDLAGIGMLWTRPTLRQLALALNDRFIAPWAMPGMAAAMLLFAAIGAARLALASRRALMTLAVAFGPYLVFDLLFQETITTRYSLPLIVPVAYVAARGLDRLADRLPARMGIQIAVLLAVINAFSTGLAVRWYSRLEAPAFRMLGDMRALTARQRKPPLAPVLAMHRRQQLDLRRPFVWLGDRAPRFSQRLLAPPKHEWLELVNYWKGGGRDEVWFVADPLRTDLALIDHGRFRHGTYRWPLRSHDLVGGVRPDVMDWYRLRQPGWYLGEGWALTPETAGVAKEDGRGPDRAPIQGWIRRRPEAATLMVGGRNLSLAGPPAPVRIAIDGRPIDEPTVAAGFFLRMLKLPAGALAGDGEYATITIAAGDVGLKPDTIEAGRPGRAGLQANPETIAIEQFDAQSADRIVFGFAEGWHEPEYNPAKGLLWRWMSDRATLRVHAAGRPLMLTMNGEPPNVYFWKPSRIRISAGGRVVAEQTLWSSFNMRVRIPAELVAADESTITIETDRTYVPAEGFRRSPDRRRLGLRVFECELRPAF